jgi:hypothetical protein
MHAENISPPPILRNDVDAIAGRILDRYLLSIAPEYIEALLLL